MNKHLWMAVAGYFALVGAATFYSNSATDSPTADTVAKLPSPGSLLGSTGTTAAAVDLGTAAAIWFFFIR